MVGLRQRATRSPPIAVKSLENMSMKVFGCISLISAPAANAFSLPVNRMQPMPSSASRSSIAAAISRNTPNDSAFSILGRFRVTMPTPPLLSTMMVSNVAMADPAQKSRAMCLLARGASRGPRGLGHEHPRCGGKRQQGAKGNEDLADQRGLAPRGIIVACGDRGLRKRGRQRCSRWLIRGFGLAHGAVELVELVGGDKFAIGCRRRRRGRLKRGGAAGGG